MRRQNSALASRGLSSGTSKDRGVTQARAEDFAEEHGLQADVTGAPQTQDDAARGRTGRQLKRQAAGGARRDGPTSTLNSGTAMVSGRLMRRRSTPC